MSTVLVADDSVGVRTLVRSALEREGHRVLEAESGSEIFETIDSEQPDVILLDVHLGVDDGVAIGLNLKKQPRYHDTKIVFMTGTMGQPELERLSKELNVEILAKPFDIATLAEAVAIP